MSDSSKRIYFVDWLRIGAVLLLFPFHTLRVFDSGDPFYVKAGSSEWVTRLLSFISVWHMPLLFFLAGASTYLALKKRSGGQYSWERAKRLLLPFCFGFLILIPPQTWLGGRFNSGYNGSYWHYLVSGDFLKWNIRDGGDYFGGFGIGHLWFILFLYLISMFALVFAVWAARGRGVKSLQSFSRRLARPLWWILAVVILFLGEAAPAIPGGPIIFYLFVFVLGYAAFCDPSFAQTAQKYRWAALFSGLVLSLFWVLTPSIRNSLPDPSFGRAGLSLLGVAGTWLTIVGFLGVGKHYLDRPSRSLAYLSEASYPVYILHQTVIVIVAFYLAKMAMPAGATWLLLLVLAVGATFALYEVVRRTGFLRLLFGMSARRRALSSVVTAPSAERQQDGGDFEVDPLTR